MISLKVRLNRYKIVKHHWTNLDENFQSIKSDSTLSKIILQCVSQCWKAMLDPFKQAFNPFSSSQFNST